MSFRSMNGRIITGQEGNNVPDVVGNAFFQPGKNPFESLYRMAANAI